MTTQTACPSVECWKQHLAGTLPDAEQAQLIQHLDSCAACQKIMDTLAAISDSFVGLARRAEEKRATNGPALHKVLQILKEDAGAESTQAEPNSHEVESWYFLDPPHKPGALGRLQQYEILQLLGRGGFGLVFKAYDETLHRFVAIKILAPQLATNSTARKRFLREALAAAAISHEHVVTIHAVDQHKGLPYIVMQYVQGRSLQERIDDVRPLELREILRIGMQIAEGLVAAHKQGLVHRDIKPGNILLENGVERVKITDFGLARAIDDVSITQSGVIAGTPQYMSPEQAAGQSIDHRTDLFSLGSVLYAMCTGEAPFQAPSTVVMLKRVAEDAPRPVRDLNPLIPDWLCDIIAKLHAKNPDDRFQSAREVADLLGQHLAHLQKPAQVPRPAPVQAPASPPLPPPARATPAWLTFFAVLIGICFSLFLFVNIVEGRRPLEPDPPLWMLVMVVAAGIILTLAWRKAHGTSATQTTTSIPSAPSHFGRARRGFLIAAGILTGLGLLAGGTSLLLEPTASPDLREGLPLLVLLLCGLGLLSVLCWGLALVFGGRSGATAVPAAAPTPAAQSGNGWLIAVMVGGPVLCLLYERAESTSVRPSLFFLAVVGIALAVLLCWRIIRKYLAVLLIIAAGFLLALVVLYMMRHESAHVVPVPRAPVPIENEDLPLPMGDGEIMPPVPPGAMPYVPENDGTAPAQPLREVVRLQEKKVERLKKLQQQGAVSAEKITSAEIELIEVRLRLAEVEQQPKQIVVLLRELVAHREAEVERCRHRLASNAISQVAMEQALQRLLEARARLKMAEAAQP